MDGRGMLREIGRISVAFYRMLSLISLNPYPSGIGWFFKRGSNMVTVFDVYDTCTVQVIGSW